MKLRRFRPAGMVLALMVSLVMTASASAGWYQEPRFSYRIHFPDNWNVREDRKNDAVNATNPQETMELAVQGLDLKGQRLSSASLENLFADNVFSGWQKLASQPDTLNALSGTTGAYSGSVDGQKVVVGAFYTIQGKYGYVLYAMMAAGQAETLSDQADAIFKTFAILRPAPPPPRQAAAPAPRPASAKPALDPIDAPYVAVKGANVRGRPGVGAAKVGALAVGERVTVLGKVRGADWYLVSRGGRKLGYVFTKLLVPEAQAARRPAPAPAPAAQPPLDPIDAPFVVVSKTRVRQRPDVRSKSVLTLMAGTEVVALGKVKGSDWILIARDDNPQGYVLGRNVKDKAEAAPAPAAPATATARLNKAKVPAGIDFGAYHALVIGNNAYSELPKLKTAVGDAEAVAATLRDAYGYKTNVLLNATRSQIIVAFEKMRRTLGKNDNLLIYYAGHGWLDKKAERGYWLPVDATEDSQANWISNTTLTDTLKAMDAKHVLVVADSCYSGTLSRGIKITKRGPEYFARLARKRARVAMTSGGVEPVADGGGGSHSAFAAAFLKALGDNDAIIDGAALFKNLKRIVMVNAPQTPEYADVRFAGHDGGDYLFVRRR